MATGQSALELTWTNICQEEIFIDMPMVLRQAVAHCRIWGLILVSSCTHVDVLKQDPEKIEDFSVLEKNVQKRHNIDPFAPKVATK